ncbi:hypothetical protein X275_01090 [Marinitoga sp. 1197]|uniref:hypothetical protein n=1 Tax=Marinitoga sp. 1197 TaxID=1428449 RepID=UPI000640DF69|nr:hypothetical protein [Marinitoga sp. 1197]AJW76945.1 single-stranded exonuclease associated with Rad50/Mre11 complex [Marinitoga camini virus 1]KLO24024.1 hypothetical protein X275_01090 [Marinitoga sp. 1197]
MDITIVNSISNFKKSIDIIKADITRNTEEINIISGYLENAEDETKSDTIIKQLYEKDTFTKLENSDMPIFLKYFVDGTVESYFWGYERKTGFPVVLAQIGVGILTFHEKKMHYKNTDYILNYYFKLKFLSKSIKPVNHVSIYKIEKEDIDTYDRNEIAGKIKSEMHNFELEKILSLVSNQNMNNHELIILDGTLQNEKFHANFEKLKGIKIIGVSKHFSKKVKIENHSYISSYLISNNNRFKAGVRTPIFNLDNKILLWYLRLYDKGLKDPLEGIIKIEIPYNDEIKDFPEVQIISLANSISVELLKFRCPNIYPDKRWSVHLYPVYLTEKYIKNKLIPKYYFL